MFNMFNMHIYSVIPYGFLKTKTGGAAVTIEYQYFSEPTTYFSYTRLV